jgi:hypothetical protein
VGLAAAFALTAAAAVIGLLISRQLPDSRPQPPAEVPGLKPADNTI